MERLSNYQAEAFIKKFYKTFIGSECKISLLSDTIEITLGGYVFGIKVLEKFILDGRLEGVTDKKISKISLQLVKTLNDICYIPLDVKLGKKTLEDSSPSVFLTSILDINDSSSQELYFILKNSSIIYTNDVVKACEIVDNRNKVKSIELLGSEKDIGEDIVCLYIGDLFSRKSDLSFLYSKFEGKQFYIYSADSHFINHYSLSLAHYGALFWGGNIGKGGDVNGCVEAYSVFLKHDIKIHESLEKDQMLFHTTYACNFISYENLFTFTQKITQQDGYYVNIIYQVENGYFHIGAEVSELNLSILGGQEPQVTISCFIFKNTLGFPSYTKFHSYDAQKSLTYLSAPLAKTTEFRSGAIQSLAQSKYIFGESLVGVQNYFKNLNITLEGKNLFFGDDLILCEQYKDTYETEDISFEIIPSLLPELYDLLEGSQKITFLSDGGAPCILDPGDYIKKYVALHYSEYSIIGIPGPNVLSTVLLGVAFEYSKVFWTPFIYSIRPVETFLKENKFFSSDFFDDTLLIFYSFASEIKNDIKVLGRLFTGDVNIQILGDIGTEYEYNRVTTIELFLKQYYMELQKKIR